jgi:hypothetical protein
MFYFGLISDKVRNIILFTFIYRQVLPPTQVLNSSLELGGRAVKKVYLLPPTFLYIVIM